MRARRPSPRHPRAQGSGGYTPAAPHGAAPHGAAPHGAAPHGAAPYGTVQHGAAEPERLDERLAAAEERERILLRSLPDTLVVLYDTDLRCLMLDGPMARRAGFNAEDYVGRPIEETLPPAQYEQLEPLIRTALAGNSCSTEWTSLISDVTYEVDIAPYRLADGTIAGAFAVARDVRERKARERELRHLAAIVEQSGEAITSEDADGNFTEWNSGAERLYGYSAAEAIGRPVSLVLPEHRRDEGCELLTRALAGETVEQFETERARKDGTLIDVSITISPVRDAHGKPVGASSVTRDVSARRRAERERDAALERFEAAFDHAPIGMAVADTEGRIVRVNEAFSWVTGYAAEELAGRTALTLVHADDVDHVQRETAPLESEVDAVTYEHRMEHAAGHLIWVQVSVTIMRDPSGAPLNALVQMLDVSEQRLYEDELQRLADHDPLTGLFNRRGFEAALDAQLARCKRYGATGALLMLDLDGFKAVNDTLGHAAGDEIIKSTADALSSRLRESDVVARLGGDEFAVLLPTQTRDEAVAVAEALLQTIRDRVTPGPDGQPGLVSASIGVAPLTDGELRAGIALGNADLAMYAAKAAGKSCYRLHVEGPAPAPPVSAG